MDKLNKSLHEIPDEADVKKQLRQLGIEAKPSSPDQIRNRLRTDIEKWSKIIDKAEIPKQ